MPAPYPKLNFIWYDLLRLSYPIDFKPAFPASRKTFCCFIFFCLKFSPIFHSLSLLTYLFQKTINYNLHKTTCDTLSKGAHDEKLVITGIRKKGLYKYNLTVEDNNKQKATDQVEVLVKPAQNKPPVAKLKVEKLHGANLFFLGPDLVLNATNSSDPNNDALKFKFSWNSWITNFF